MNYSILMSVYYKEKPEYLRQAIESMLNQTVKSNDFVIVCDGILTKELYDVLSEFEQNNCIHRIQLDENFGLGYALQKGLVECKNELIARMDSDDISVNNRIELQLRKFKENKKLVVCGGYVQEFKDNVKGQVKSVPLSNKEIIHYSKKRNPFNHMTVMFKKEHVIEVGNYVPFYLNEDYLLWAKLIIAKKEVLNIGEILAYMRVDNDLYNRRGGLKYALTDLKLQNTFYRMGLTTFSQRLLNTLIRMSVRVIPCSIRKSIYKNILRNRG